MKVPLLVLLLTCALLPAAELKDETGLTTVFAFDQVSLPHTQNLRLEMRQPQRHVANPVLKRGARGTPDAYGVQFYGSVIREGDLYRMWYVAFDDDEKNKVTSARWRAAYAESKDGVEWVKPSLGLVEYAGSKENNLILTEPAPLGFVNLKVLRDEAAADPEQRYKISTHVYFRDKRRLGTLAPFVSLDGLRWQLMKSGVVPLKGELRKKDLFLPGVHFEPCGGLYQWGGMYYICGQNAMPDTHHYQGRVVRLYRSADFAEWSETSTLAFVRSPQHEYLGAGRSREGEQNHEGICVWNRGNVLLGITGRWHGAAEWKDVTVDLGFVCSNDGLHFREPQHEWTFLQRGEDGQWDQGGLLQGQGFENVGEQTFIYYGAWDPRTWEHTEERGGVGIATLPRDRFADLVPDESGLGPGDYQMESITCECVTQQLELPAQPQFLVNAHGLHNEAWIEVELLNEQERLLPGYSGKAAAKVMQSGYQTPVQWQSSAPLPQRVKMRLRFMGKRRTDIRFSALYVGSFPTGRAVSDPR